MNKGREEGPVRLRNRLLPGQHTHNLLVLTGRMDRVPVAVLLPAAVLLALAASQGNQSSIFALKGPAFPIRPTS